MEIQSEALARTLEGLKTKGFDYLKKITAVDRVDHLEVVYILYSTINNEHEIVLTQLPSENPEIGTAMKFYKAADWYERELSEMFGIKIKGRKAKRLLLEKWNGAEAPLRKSFEWANPNYKKL
ncbi:MAG: NADH-quinone oxidoreductase subunit C [Candidatus Micrarchaeota archaeon]|nr:NADH-quinone oxidoreductase subunit C [Candidatus Micrarchaeota archaeon]